VACESYQELPEDRLHVIRVHLFNHSRETRLRPSKARGVLAKKYRAHVKDQHIFKTHLRVELELNRRLRVAPGIVKGEPSLPLGIRNEQDDGEKSVVSVSVARCGSIECLWKSPIERLMHESSCIIPSNDMKPYSALQTPLYYDEFSNDV
jgi:hypothetical protein